MNGWYLSIYNSFWKSSILGKPREIYSKWYLDVSGICRLTVMKLPLKRNFFFLLLYQNRQQLYNQTHHSLSSCFKNQFQINQAPPPLSMFSPVEKTAQFPQFFIINFNYIWPAPSPAPAIALPAADQKKTHLQTKLIWNCYLVSSCGPSIYHL